MLTVIFATRNGEAVLPAVLNSFARLESPQGGWQLVVADNGSTDRTRQILESFRDRLPLRCLAETRPGKNAALNAALEYVDGDLVVLTDDDVFPRTDWLVRLRAAADARPDYDIFGGAILPRWEVPPPEWLLRRVPAGPTFTLTDAALADGATGAHNVFGPNMAVRAAIFSSGGRFATSIGPNGRNYAMGSETEFVRRLLSHGHRAWHVREAVVEHFVRKSQMTQESVLHRAVRFGRGQYRLSPAGQATATKHWRGVPRYLYRQMLGHVARLLAATLRFDGDAVFHARWNLNYVRGQILEARLIHKAADIESGSARIT